MLCVTFWGTAIVFRTNLSPKSPSAWDEWPSTCRMGFIPLHWLTFPSGGWARLKVMSFSWFADIINLFKYCEPVQHGRHSHHTLYWVICVSLLVHEKHSNTKLKFTHFTNIVFPLMLTGQWVGNDHLSGKTVSVFGFSGKNLPTPPSHSTEEKGQCCWRVPAKPYGPSHHLAITSFTINAWLWHQRPLSVFPWSLITHWLIFARANPADLISAAAHWPPQ